MGGSTVGRVVGALVLAAAAILPAAARADVGLSLPPVDHDNVRGFRFGEFVLIPTVGLEGRYNSNFFRTDTRDQGTIAPAWSVTVSPGFVLRNPNPSWVHLTWDAEVGVHWYFGDDANVGKQGRVSAATTLRADFLPKSVVGAFITDTYIREVAPRNYSSSGTYDRNYNHAEGGIQIRPGGGALELSLSGGYNIDLFDNYRGGVADLKYPEGRLLLTWDFFPKTTFLFDATVRYMQWGAEEFGANPNVVVRSNSIPFRAVTGVKGYITKKIALQVKAGYGRGFYQKGEDIQTGIGEASVAFKPTAFTVLDLGYKRDFFDSYYARYFVGDAVHLTVQQQFANRLNLELSGTYTYVSFGNLTGPLANGFTASDADRRDHAVTAQAKISFSILRYLAISAGYQFDGIFTNFFLQGPNSYRDYGGYMAHQGFANISVLY